MQEAEADNILQITLCHLTEVPTAVFTLMNLKVIKLFGNKLKSLPPEMCQLSNLTELWIYDNELAVLPPEIGQLRNLTALWAYKNKLTSLPREIASLSSLQTLDVCDNAITRLPREMANLSSLQTLNVFGNPLPYLPCDFYVLNIRKFKASADILRNYKKTRNPTDFREYVEELKEHHCIYHSIIKKYALLKESENELQLLPELVLSIYSKFLQFYDFSKFVGYRAIESGACEPSASEPSAPQKRVAPEAVQPAKRSRTQ
eukprot:TRINITY_DN2195_c0_g1_i2.p1 TRINITY_DN2195_c0_g1~~TRINITY_DN2195_c0_g1_i2.p1  ORF type:complete len:285 (-),score=35.42 TRINITY_DN2195_c0_g1_i2:114-893(-)